MDKRGYVLFSLLVAFVCFEWATIWRPAAVHAQVTSFRINFTSASTVDLTVTPGPDYIVQCYDSNGFWILPRSIWQANPTLIEFQFSTPTSGRCIAK